MQRKGNAIRRESQVKNQISIGIDMGGSLWATAVQDWEAGKMSYYGLRDKVDQSKEDRVFDLVSNLRKSGKRIDVFYEAGRYGYWPARKLIALGANVHILPVNKLQVIMSGKTIKTDKLDAKFLAGLHPSDHVPTVYIPTLEEEGRRDAEREWDRIKKSIDRVRCQVLNHTGLLVNGKRQLEDGRNCQNGQNVPACCCFDFPICLPNWSCSRRNCLPGNRPFNNSKITMKKRPNKKATRIRQQRR